MGINNIKNSGENLSFIDFSSEINRNNELYRALIDLSSLGKNGKEFLLKNSKNEEKKLKAKYSKGENGISGLEIYENLKDKDGKIEERRILFMNLENGNSFIGAGDEETLRVNSKDFFVEKEFANWFGINSGKSNSKDGFSKIICNYENGQKISLILNAIEAVFSTKDQIRDLKEEVSKEENFYYDKDGNKVEIKVTRVINILGKNYNLSDEGYIIDQVSRNKIVLKIKSSRHFGESEVYTYLQSVYEKFKILGKNYYEFGSFDKIFENGGKNVGVGSEILDENLKQPIIKYNGVDRKIESISYTTGEKKYIGVSINGLKDQVYYDIRGNSVDEKVATPYEMTGG